jgi:hypothetical protein
MVGVAEKEVPCKIHRAQELLISISSRQKKSKLKGQVSMFLLMLKKRNAMNC